MSLAAFQTLTDIVRQWECAAARLGLEVVAADKLALAVNPDFSDLVPDLECAGFKVNILPAESEDPAAAQAVDDPDSDDALDWSPSNSRNSCPIVSPRAFRPEMSQHEGI